VKQNSIENKYTRTDTRLLTVTKRQGREVRSLYRGDMTENFRNLRGWKATAQVNRGADLQSAVEGRRFNPPIERPVRIGRGKFD